MHKKVTQVAAIQICIVGVTLLDRVVLSSAMLRSWGLESFEGWTVAVSIAGLFAVFDLGLQQSYSNHYAKAVSENLAQLQQSVGVALAINTLVLLVGLVCLAALFTSQVIQQLTPTERSTHGLEPTITVLAIATLAQNFSSALAPIYRAQGRLPSGAAMELVLAVGRMSAVLGTTLVGGSPLSAASSYLGTTVFYVFLLLPFHLKQHSTVKISLRPQWPLQENLRYLALSAPFFFVQGATTQMLLSLPVVMLGRINDKGGEVAAFFVLRTVFSSVRTLAGFIANAYCAQIETKKPEARRSVQTEETTIALGEALSLVCFVGVALILAASGGVLQIWSKSLVTRNENAAICLALCSGVASASAIAHSMLSYRGEARRGAFAKVANAIAALFLAYLLLPPLNSAGIALGLLIGELIGAVILIYWVAPTLNADPKVLFLRWLLWPIFAGALGYSAVALAISSNGVMTLKGALLSGLLALPVVGLVLLRSRALFRKSWGA